MDTTNQLIIIGPLGVGKSTVAKILSDKLDMERCCYDEIKVQYLQKAGLDLTEARRIRDSDGVYQMYLYTNLFEIEALKNVLADHPNKIIDLGAGAHCFEDTEQQRAASDLFKTLKHVVLMLPAEDLDASIRHLPGAKERRYLNTHFIMHDANQALSTQTVYTLGKTPEQTATEIEDIVLNKNKDGA